jgi:hypothetical protein
MHTMSEDTKPDQFDTRNQPPTPPAGVAGQTPAADGAQPQAPGADQPASGAAPQGAAPQAPAQPQQPAAAPQQTPVQPQQPATGADGNGSRNPFQLPDDQMPFIPNPNYKGDKPAQMSGAMKALWIVLGMMIGIFSLLVAVISFLGSDVRTRSLRSQALKYSCIGVILGALLDMVVLGVMGVDLSSVASLGTGAATGGSSSTGSAF